MINYAGTGSDPENGTLGASAFTWQVDFHHADHTHPFIQAFSGGTSGSFTIPTNGEPATNVFYRIYLTVKDSAGLTNTTFRDIKPQLSTITLASKPAGFQLTLDGQPVSTPTSFQSVVGVQRTIGVSGPQTLNSIAYEFASWSDSGAATHTISTSSSNKTYTATFRQSGRG